MANQARIVWILIGFAAAGAFVAWRLLQPPGLPEGIAASNGRIEAIEIDIAAKIPGRLADVLVHEGDFVTAGQTLAKMDDSTLQAELREAEADLNRARTQVESAKSNVHRCESEKAAAESIVEQRKAELVLAETKLARSEKLAKSEAVPIEEVETNRAGQASAKAAVSKANADVAASDAAIAAAQSDVIAAEASVIAATAKIERLKVDIDDSVLKSPRDGRVQFRIAEPGEVLNAGGKVLNLVDLGEVYMTFFLPTAQAGRIQMGADVHIVLDAAPQFVFPAKASFVADVAQFTPKTVETAEERQKLMFRIKAYVDPDLLKQHIRSVKTGLPGMAYVKLDPKIDWPENLQIKLPPPPATSP